MNFKLLSFLMIILIISITPVSAGLTQEYLKENGNTTFKNVAQDESQLVNFENSINNIEKDISEIEGYTNSLKEDTSYLKERGGDYGWKFWKWPKITYDLLKTLLNMQNNFNNILKPLNQINEESNTLNPKITDNKGSVSYVNNVNSPFCEEDACQMACELTKAMNTTFTVRNVNVSELCEGDIVQYLSQGKYPRYLAVQKKLESTNSSGRQLLGNTPIDVSSCVLKGTGDKLVEAPLIGNVICLVPLNKINTYDTLQKSVHIQQNGINNVEKRGEKLQEKSKRLDTTLLSFGWITAILGGVSLILLLSALSSTPIPPISAPIMVAAAISTGLFTLSGVITASLYLSSKRTNSMANNLKFNTILNQDDLNSYTKTGEKNETLFMDVSTFNGIPIIKKPPISDWKEFAFILIEKPLHGDLLPGPGLQFLYSPYEGYTGNDTFKYQYTDKYGLVKGYVTVNVQIKNIPTFLGENNGTITKPGVDNSGKEYDNIYELGTGLLTVFDEASNTELTNEQKQYLTEHQNRILNKAETIIYNLQNFLNTLYKEYHEKTNENDENPTQRKLLKNREDKFTKDANEMVTYLNNTSDKIEAKTLNCNYTELINLTQNGTYKDRIIVQIKDGEYIRYMKLINITNTNIELKSGDLEIKNDFVSNLSDSRFNIIIVPQNQNINKILKIIWKKQRDKIRSDLSLWITGKITCTTLIGVGGVSVMAVGAYRLVDYCNNPTKQIITEIINTGDLEEGAALLKPDQLIKTYTRITQEISNDSRFNKKTTAISIVICGTLIAIGSIIGFGLCYHKEQKCTDEKDNLKEYEPEYAEL